MSTIVSLHFTAAVSGLNVTLIPTAYYSAMETQNHAYCKLSYTLLFFYISEELMTQQEVAYPLEKQEFTPKNKTKKKQTNKKKRKEEEFNGFAKLENVAIRFDFLLALYLELL